MMVDAVTGGSIQACVTQGIDLSTLSHAEKDDLILSLVGQLEAALARIGELEKRLGQVRTSGQDAGQFLSAAVERAKA